jgi:hypothetical protein
MKAQTTASIAPPPLVAGNNENSRDTSGKTSGHALSRETNEALTRAIQMSERTNDLGGSALNSLGKQGEVIRHSVTTVDETNMNLRDSRRTLRDMRFLYWKDKLGKALVIASLLLIIGLIIYFKWIKRLRGN